MDVESIMELVTHAIEANANAEHLVEHGSHDQVEAAMAHVDLLKQDIRDRVAFLCDVREAVIALDDAWTQESIESAFKTIRELLVTGRTFTT